MFMEGWIPLVGIVGGALALIDSILRLRTRRGSRVVGVIEIIVAALFLLSLFVPGVPWGWLVLGVALLVVLVVTLVTGGRTRIALPIVAIVLVVLFLLLMNRWLIIPGFN